VAAWEVGNERREKREEGEGDSPEGFDKDKCKENGPSREKGPHLKAARDGGRGGNRSSRLKHADGGQKMSGEGREIIDDGG